MKKFMVLLVISFLTINCSDSSTNETENSKKNNKAGLNDEYKIRLGDSTFIANMDLTIKFNSVEDDSRCPKGAVCVWEGNATVVLRLKNPQGDTQTANLNTSLDPREVKFSNLTIALKELTPYPILDSVINPSDYRATLLVKE